MHDKIISTVKVISQAVKISARKQKIQPDFRNGYAQPLHFKNRAEKNERKKIEDSQLP